MSVSYLQAQKKQVRVTLDLDVYSDFDPLEGDETVNVYVEDLEVDW
jgi:hypothetical protein